MIPHCFWTQAPHHSCIVGMPLRGEPFSPWNLNYARFETLCGSWEEFHIPVWCSINFIKKHCFYLFVSLPRVRRSPGNDQIPGPVCLCPRKVLVSDTSQLRTDVLLSDQQEMRKLLGLLASKLPQMGKHHRPPLMRGRRETAPSWLLSTRA